MKYTFDRVRTAEKRTPRLGRAACIVLLAGWGALIVSFFPWPVFAIDAAFLFFGVCFGTSFGLAIASFVANERRGWAYLALILAFGLPLAFAIALMLLLILVEPLFSPASLVTMRLPQS